MGIRTWRRTKRRETVVAVAAPRLDDAHLVHCQLVSDRYRLLEYLPQQAIVAEVGVAYGEFSTEILQRTDPRELHLIDLEQRWGNRFDDHVEKVRTQLGDSAEVLATYPDGFFDWIYIAADHSYEKVRQDAEVAKMKIKKEGLLVFNDYTVYDPFLALPYGVPRVVHELCREENWEMIYLALEPTGFYDVVLRRS